MGFRCCLNDLYFFEREAAYINIRSPGTTQACLFRDEFTSLTATGYSIYGLSTDSPKSNSTFKTKHNLPYTLLCDPATTLIGAIGMKKPPSGTVRGVFVVNKDGKVEALSPGVSLALPMPVSTRVFNVSPGSCCYR